MLLRRGILGLSLLILLCTNLTSQALSTQLPFVHYTNEQGLSQMNVRAIIQDQDGYIWIGTEDGLNKFDGYDFKVYRNIRNDNTSLPDNFIYTLYPSADGGIWVGTNNGGLAKYNVTSDEFKVYQHNPDDENTISSNRVESIYEDADGIVWIGTAGATPGLNRIDPQTGEIKRFLRSEEDWSKFTSTSVISIIDDESGKLWVRTYTDFLVLDKETLEYTKPDLPLGQVDDVSDKSLLYENGFIWATFGNSLLKINSTDLSYEQIYFSNIASDNLLLLDIHKFDDKHFWLSDYANGIYLFNKEDNSIINFSHDEKRVSSIMQGITLTILQDRTGALWVGTHSKGMSKLNINRKKFGHYFYDANDPQSLKGNVIRAILVDSDNEIWLSADSKLEKLIPSFEEDRYVRDNSFDYDTLFDKMPNCFFEDSYGGIWIGTWGSGVVLLKEGDINQQTNMSSFDSGGAILDDIVQAIYEDRTGNIWIGSEAGLSLYNPTKGEFRHFTHDPNNENTICPLGVQSNTILEDAFGNIWVGTWGGLTCMVPRDKDANTFDTEYDFIRYQNDPENVNSLSDNRVISIHYDQEVNPKEIYAGTYGMGLNILKFDPEDGNNYTVKNYTRNEGLPNDVVYTILSDHNGKIWFSTNEGLGCFDPENEKFIVYDANDGLQANQFWWGANAKGNNNELIFGGVNGFNLFNPDDIVRDQSIASIVFTDLKVLNNSVSVNEKVNKNVILKQNINKSEKIKLTHRENVFTIEFAGLHYAFPEANNYKYMLEGFDEDWVNVDGKKRFASYTNLDPGSYTFFVDASNYDGVWTEDPRSIEIVIKAPFWKRWWFRVFMLLIIVYIGNRFYQDRAERIKHDKEVLEQKIKEGQVAIEQKVAEVEKQKENIRKRDAEEQEIRFVNRGIVKFSEILSNAGDNLKNMAQNIIMEMVPYVGGISGVIYVLNDDDSNNQFLELTGYYAVDEEKLDKTRIDIGESYVGTCFKDGKSIIVNNVPETYSQFSSGLGESLPASLCFIPIKQRNIIQGVIEITSFVPLEKFKVQFVEKIVENITSSISIVKANNRMNLLLESSNSQTEELRAQEEEMRQNMEEMYATQEELQRQLDSIESLQSELKTAKALLDSLMGNLPDYVYFKDKESKFIRISESMLPLFPYDSIEEMVGKSDFDFHKKEAAREFYNEEQEIIKSRKGFVDKEVHEITKNNTDQWVAVTKLPLTDQDGNCIGTFGISKDISERKKYQDLAQKLEAEIKAKDKQIKELEKKLGGK